MVKDNHLLIATPHELFRYSDGEIETLFRTPSEGYINALFITRDQSIYIGSNKGFWLYKNDISYHYNSKNGTNSDYIYNFYEDRNGIVWIITGNGFMAFNSESVKETLPPSIHLYKKQVHNNNAVLAYKSISLEYPEEIEFEYKLANTSWRKLKEPEIEMSNLNPGRYLVSIRGKRINSRWSIPIQTAFKVRPKWYQFTVFKITIYLILTLAMISFFLFRLRIIKKRNQVLFQEIQKRTELEHKVANLREEIARDFHDEIGNKIASVIGLSNILKTQKNQHNSKIEKITELSREVYNTTKDFVWSLNPKNNNLESLCKYLRDYGEVFFDLFDDIDFIYEEHNITEVEMPYIKSRNIIHFKNYILAEGLWHIAKEKFVGTFGSYRFFCICKF